MMAIAAEPSDALSAAPRLRSDSLAESVVILMLLTLVQPVVGFVRGVLFCRWLDPAQLGEWDIALGFLTLAAPLVVLGIPGSFGRYVEYYRQRKRVRQFLLLSGSATLLLTLLAMVALWCAAGRFSQWIFGAADQTLFIWLLGLALLPLVAFGFVTELLNAFRLYRLVSALQLLRSVSFLALGGLLLFAVQMSAQSVVVAYAVASLLTVALGSFWICQAWRDSPDHYVAGRESLVMKVMPFALWVWAANIITNLFQIVDRYLMVHYSGLTPTEALELVGNYHSARVVPLMIVLFANMLGSILLPHFSYAWEHGRRDEVNQQVKLALKIFGLAITAGSAVFLWSAPLLFGWALEGKYAAGQDVLPWTLAACIWFGVATIAQMYLWCQEQAKLGSVALFVGLLASVALNIWLLPTYQLWGAVWACAGSMLVMLGCVYAFCRRLGLPLDAGIWITGALPVALVLGPVPALAVTAVVALWGFSTTRIFSDQDKGRLWAVLDRYRAKFAGNRQPEAADLLAR